MRGERDHFLRLAGAEEAYTCALALAEELDDPKRIADANRELGVVLASNLRAWFVAQRAVALLVPLPLLLVARASFHRFDPVRVKVAAKGQSKWLSRINAALKPLTGWLSGRGLITADAAMTVTSAPLIAVAVVVAAFAPPEVAFAALAIAIADVACRDQRAGTAMLIRSAPRVRERFVWWKTASAGVIALVMLGVPALRTGLRGVVPLAAGAFFVVAAATALASSAATPRRSSSSSSRSGT